MDCLVDTHVVLWWLNNDKRLTDEHRMILSNPDNLCFVSSATIWEIAIKSGLGKLTIPRNYLDILVEQGFRELKVSWRHSHETGDLPPYHRDPFDRMLIAQAKMERLTLLSVDENIRKYGISVV